MKTPFHPNTLRFSRWLAFVGTICCLVGQPAVHAESFSTSPQRADVDTAKAEADKAATNAKDAQDHAPTDAAQGTINAAEDAADTARASADQAQIDAEHAQEKADRLAKTARTKEEVQAAKDAATAATTAATNAKTAEDDAKTAETHANTVVNNQIKADNGAHLGRLKVHTAREKKRKTRQRLAKMVLELEHVWARAVLDPAKKGVKITEEERQKTQEKINEGRRALGWVEIALTIALADAGPGPINVSNDTGNEKIPKTPGEGRGKKPDDTTKAGGDKTTGDKKTGDQKPKDGTDEKTKKITTETSKDEKTQTDKNGFGDIVEVREYKDETRKQLTYKTVYGVNKDGDYTETVYKYVKEKTVDVPEIGKVTQIELYPEGEYDVTFRTDGYWDWDPQFGKYWEPETKETTHYTKNKPGKTTRWYWRENKGVRPAGSEPGEWVEGEYLPPTGILILPKTNETETTKTTGKETPKTTGTEKTKTTEATPVPIHGDSSFHTPDTILKETGRAETIRRGVDETFATLVATGKIKVTTAGTGETIGHVVDMTIQNNTGRSVLVDVPPVVFESKSRKNQHYACFSKETVSIEPHGTKVVPMNGVCLDRTKPPVGKGVTGDLVVNDGNPASLRNPDSHLKTKDAGKLLRIAKSKYEIVEKLQKQGAFKDLPYKDPQVQKDIMVQWSMWTDPRITEITGTPPATKEDLRKTVYKQTEEHTPLTPEIKTKLDTGIETLFSKIQLTTVKAKDVEQPEPQEHEETTVNPDGSRTTTTTFTDSGGNTTVSATTEYTDDTKRTVTTVTYKSGGTMTQTIERDGSTSIVNTVTDEDGTKITTTSTVDKNTGVKSDTITTVMKDGTKTTKTVTTDKDGKRLTRSRETINPDGSKEFFVSNPDGSGSYTSTDKDGKTWSIGHDANGKTTGKNAKGTYTAEKQGNGSILVKWDLPNGTGGAKTFSEGTPISPNTDDESNPLPFKVTPKP